jgi:hypothetical protein
MNTHNPILSLAVMGGVVATVQLYNDTAPSLQGLRSRPPNDTTGRQQLLDADLLVGSTVFVAGAFASWGVSSYVPFIALMMVFLITSYWHHAVLNSPNGHTTEVIHVG